MPVLQNDKRIATEFTTEQAEKMLFGNSEPLAAYKPDVEIATNFNLSHDLQAYDELVDTRYQSGSVAEKPVLENYFVTKDEVDTRDQIETQKYINNDNPLPYSPFKPRIFGTNLQEIDTSLLQSTKTLNQTLEKIAEVNFTPAVKEEVQEEIAYSSKMKLNAKGIIAVCTFFAVVALVVALIVVNSVSIGSGSSRISTLRAANIAVSMELEQAELERDIKYNDKVIEIENMVKAPDSGYTQLGTPTKLPNLSTWRKVSNLDAGTNLFDQISKFLSGLFH